jgi:hypothetical protein
LSSFKNGSSTPDIKVAALLGRVSAQDNVPDFCGGDNPGRKPLSNSFAVHDFTRLLGEGYLPCSEKDQQAT